MDPNEPTLPSAEQMRARRLAKLGQSATPTSSSNKSTSETSQADGASSPAAASAATAAAAPSSTGATGSPSSSSTSTPAKSFSPVIRPGNAASGSTSTSTSKSNSKSNSNPTTSTSSKRPFADVDPGASSTQAAPAARRVPTTTGPPRPGTASASTAVPSQPTAIPTPAESLADWTDTIISNVLRVSLDASRTQNHHGQTLTYLPGLQDEIREREGIPVEEEASEEQDKEKDQPTTKKKLRFSVDDIDPAISEAGSTFNPKKPLLEYLLPSYKAVSRLLKTRITDPKRIEVLQELKRLLMSNIIFALTMPEYFGREPNPEHDTIVPNLLRGVRPDDNLSLDMDFITEAIKRFEDDDEGQVQGIFTQAMLEISNKLATLTMNDEYLPYVDALLTYTRFRPLLVALTNHPSFQTSEAAPSIETRTILGPFFRISPLQADVAKTYFGGHGGRYREPFPQRETVNSALQMTLMTHQGNLHNIAMAFARAGDGPRNTLLDWFAYIMNVNHKRRAIQVDRKEVSTDGFMMNVAAVLDRMCEPFMEANFSRMERIDIDYLRRKPRVDIADETKLNADQAQSDKFYATTAPGESKFVSELFFLNMASHHYGHGATGEHYKDMDREIQHMENQLAQLAEEYKKLTAAGARPNPMAVALVERHQNTFKAAIDRHVAYKFALEAVLSDEKMQQRSLMFMRVVSVWLLRVASGSDYTPDKELQLPLPAEEPEAFSCLPEYALQNIVDHFKFLFRSVPRILPSAVGDEMVALALTFLESSEYIRNPYLKSSLVSLLFSGTWRMYHLANGVLGDALMNGKFANRHLLHAVMKFYIECESTGASSQFYDKFNIRYEIFQVIKAVWPNDLYKHQLTQQTRTNREFFVRFVNLLLNDATYVLDEALSRFPKIHDLQKELMANEDMSPEDRQQKESELKAAEGQAQSYMQLANETVAMMKLFTEALGQAFTMPEIVSRLAGMLDYNLVTLAGPTSRNLKVLNPEKYHFNPKVLLPELVGIYLNLADKSTFVDAVAADGRSYKPDIFDNATRILTTKGLMDPDQLQRWEALLRRIATAKQIADQAELDLGEIPENFEDPIMGDLMHDPVVLPSKHIVDRSTIIQHLLSDPKDPFTRQPMTMDDVEPATELLAEIEAWKAERIATAKAKHEAAAAAGEGVAQEGAGVTQEGDNDKMDTTEG